MRMTSPLIALMLAALLAGCGERSEPAPTPAPAAPEAPSPPPAAPPPAEPEATPVAATPDPAAGAEQYRRLCATCHGEDGCGGGPGAAALDPKPAKHCDGEYMNALSDEHLFKVVKLGGPAVGKSPLMAPWGGVLSDDQVWDVVAFMRSIADPPYAPPGG